MSYLKAILSPPLNEILLAVTLAIFSDLNGKVGILCYGSSSLDYDIHCSFGSTWCFTAPFSPEQLQSLFLSSTAVGYMSQVVAYQIELWVGH